jgi:hypothetical protein
MCLLGYYLLASAADNTIGDSAFVASAFQRSGYYDRVYRDMLDRPEFEPWIDSFIGGFQVPADEKEALLREIAPEEYLRAETKRNVSELWTYLDGSEDSLDLYIDLEIPLQNSHPVMVSFVERNLERRDALLVSTREELTREIATYLNALNDGTLPDGLPAARTVPAEQRAEAYRDAFTALGRNDESSEPVITQLSQSQGETLDLIRAGRLEEALIRSGHTVVGVRVGDAQEFILEKSDINRRLHLLEQLAENSDRTSAEIAQDFARLRWILGAAGSPITRWSALVVAALCFIGIAAIFVPYWKHFVFWPSLTLLIMGAVFLILALSTTLETNYWVSWLCQGNATGRCALRLDILRELAIGMGAEVVESTLKIILAGSVGLLLSIIVAKLVPDRREG